MQILDIAWKDMRLSFRNRGAIIFMFVVPVLVTVLFYFMFGRIAGEEETFAVPPTTVALVNLDVPGVQPMGALLGQVLHSEALADLLTVMDMTEVGAGYTAVDQQEAAVAVIIPANFSAIAMSASAVAGGTGETAVVELYADPTLTIGPAIVASVVRRFVDGVAAVNMGIGLILEQMTAAGVPLTPALVQGVVQAFTAVTGSGADSALVRLVAPPRPVTQESDLAQLLSLILSGMMVFYAFFTGSNVLQSILTEQEQGTLQRLFTMPLSQVTLFSGKFLAALLVLAVQETVLLVFGWLVFGISWGQPIPLLITAVGLMLISATTGLFLVSLLRSTRQAGAIYGGLLTLTGMLGLFTVFTGGAANTPDALETISLFVPQGWAIRAFQQTLDGRPLSELLFTFAGVLLWSVLFFWVGQYRLKRRFA